MLNRASTASWKREMGKDLATCALYLVLFATVFQTGQSDVATTPCSDDHGTKKCNIANAGCDNADKCKCNDGYKPTADTCTKILGTQCSTATDCGSLKNVACTSSQCTCASGFKEDGAVCNKGISSAIWMPSSLLITVLLICSYINI